MPDTPHSSRPQAVRGTLSHLKTFVVWFCESESNLVREPIQKGRRSKYLRGKEDIFITSLLMSFVIGFLRW